MKCSIRMYRQGLGDCFLLGFPKKAGGTFFVMIDCGVILGQPDAAKNIQAVADSVKLATGGHVDLLIATHEHWDHISGFSQAETTFRSMTFGAVWLAWTENPADPQAAELAKQHGAALAVLRMTASRLKLFGAAEEAAEVSGLIDLFGVAGGKTTHDALNVIRDLGGKNLRYCDPTDPPVELGDTGVRAYALGPPRDPKLLKTLSKSASSPEMYGLDASSLSTGDSAAPFDGMQAIPTAIAREMPFFKDRYWGSAVMPPGGAPDWRRIDEAFLDAASDLALQLDSATNNTSLVVAFEIGDELLLFPGDAQIGSWLSWQTLSWKVGETTVTGPDLLKRATFYKVGHHGSHNATARASGLEIMTSLRSAMIPVDHDEAVKKHWDRMPLAEIVDDLKRRAKHGVFRIDEDPAPGAAAQSKENYIELTL